ncbi:MAG: flagellar assembly protein FliW [Bacteriovoracaceae bacterium]
MKIKTSRFGELEVDKSDILLLNEGLLGFESLKKFFIVDPGDNTLILWLQSTENPTVAFPLIEPKIFDPNYIVKLLPADLKNLELDSVNDAKVYTVLTIPSDVTQMTANMKAPLVINSKKQLARQVVLQDSKLSVRLTMYKELKTYIVKYSSDDSIRTSVKTTILTGAEEAATPATDENLENITTARREVSKNI